MVKISPRITLMKISTCCTSPNNVDLDPVTLTYDLWDIDLWALWPCRPGLSWPWPWTPLPDTSLKTGFLKLHFSHWALTHDIDLRTCPLMREVKIHYLANMNGTWRINKTYTNSYKMFFFIKWVFNHVNIMNGTQQTGYRPMSWVFSVC